MMTSEQQKERPKPAAHDETPSNIVDHPFEPKGEWWSLCGFRKDDGDLCNLAESAHQDTTLRFHYYSDDSPDE